jgi:1,4-dihydroxy-2-naphthoate octaprenyltransferase
VSNPGHLQAWWLAARPKTLAAGLVPVLVGTSIAQLHGGVEWVAALACATGSLLIQIATNLANDYFDHKKGADTADRVGPARAVQQGWISPKAMATATAMTLLAALVVGLYLIAIGGWPIAVIGVLSLGCAVAYTGGPMPLAYVGLGDLFVFLFFGLAAVCGTCFVQIHHVPPSAWFAGAAIGLLATAILVVNNLRDRETDALANKRTLAVRFGPRVARMEHMICILGAYGLITLAVGVGIGPTSWLLTLLSIPLAAKEILSVRKKDGPDLNAHLAGAARLELLVGMLLCIGAWL